MSNTLDTTLQLYLQQCKARNFSKRTITSKEQILTCLSPADSPETLCTLAYKRMERFKTTNGKILLHKVVMAFVNWMHENEYIDAEYLKQVKKNLVKPRGNERPVFEYIDPLILIPLIEKYTEPKEFIFGVSGDNSRNRYHKNETRQALLLMLKTGLRVGECLELTGGDIKAYDDTPELRVLSKGNKDGFKDSTPIPLDMLDELKARMIKEAVFEVSRSNLENVMQKIKKELKVQILTPHSLRHIFATSLIKQGENLELIRRLLRHKSITTTIKYYSHLGIKDLAEAQARLKHVRSSLSPLAQIKQIEAKLQESRIDEMRDTLNIEWIHTEKGGFILTVSPR